MLPKNAILKFMFAKKATKIDEIFTVDLTFYQATVFIIAINRMMKCTKNID